MLSQPSSSVLAFLLRGWKAGPKDFRTTSLPTCISVFPRIMRSTNGNPSPPPLPSSHVCKHRNKDKVCFEWCPATAQCLAASLVLVLDDLNTLFPDTLATELGPFVSEELDKAIDNLTLLSLFSQDTLRYLLQLFSIGLIFFSAKRSGSLCEFLVSYESNGRLLVTSV